MSRITRWLAVLGLLFSLAGCASDAQTTAAPIIAYDDFRQLERALPEHFRPTGLQWLNPDRHLRELYGLDQALPWGKRGITAVDAAGTKPSQFRHLLVSEDGRVAVLVQVMYTETVMPKDVVGMVALPEEEGRISGRQITVQPLPRRLQLFSYHNLIFLVEVYQAGAQVVDGDQLGVVSLTFGKEIRTVLDEQPYLQP